MMHTLLAAALVPLALGDYSYSFTDAPIQEGALAVGEKSGNLGMYLGLGVKEDIVEPENEICT